MAAFHHGEIGIFTPKTQAWEIFAQGLHEPLGVLAEKDGSVLVMQRPELTRLKASTRQRAGGYLRDGVGRLWHTGNYHEFAFGPVRGPNGKLYVSLNCASSGDTVHEEIRGEWSPIGLAAREILHGRLEEGEQGGGAHVFARAVARLGHGDRRKDRARRRPSRAASARPDGIGFDPQGNLLVDDNQGDWLGASKVFIVKRGGFYGHPASLVWRKDWTGENPLKVPIEKLNSLRTPAAIWFPYGTMANSPTQLVTIPKTPAWGPFGGQTLVGEMNFPRILRVLPEEVDGVWEGACLPFIEGDAVKRGGHRFVFSGDTLWMGRTHLSWAGAEGLATIKPTGKVPFVPLEMHVTPKGFRFVFTEPLNTSAADAALWKVSVVLLYTTSRTARRRWKRPRSSRRASRSPPTAAPPRWCCPPMKLDYQYDFDLKDAAQCRRRAAGEFAHRVHAAQDPGALVWQRGGRLESLRSPGRSPGNPKRRGGFGIAVGTRRSTSGRVFAKERGMNVRARMAPRALGREGASATARRPEGRGAGRSARACVGWASRYA